MTSSEKSGLNPLLGGPSAQVRAGLAAHRRFDAAVSPVEGDLGVAARHEAVREALLDHAHLSNQGNFILATGGENAPPALITQSDPPEHTALRDLLRPAFRRNAMVNAAPWIEEHVASLIDGLPDNGPADIIGDLALPLTAYVISRLIGVPQEDSGTLAALSIAVTAFIPGDFTQTPDWERLEAYFTEKALERRTLRNRPDDVLTALVTGMVDGRTLTDREVAVHAWQIFVAGLESTAYTIGWTVYHLLVSAERWEALRMNRSLLANAREEGLRHCTAIRWVLRSAKSGTSVGDATVRAGERLIVGLESANLDEAVFGADAAEFDLYRESARRHLAFGHGVHLCLGAELSRLEISAMLNALLDRMPGLRLRDGFHYEDVASPIFSGPRSVDVVFA